MKILIAYSSVTGNTKKIGTAIHEIIENSDLKDIKDVDSLDYDIIIVGSWIDKGTADRKSLDFIEKINNKKIAFFYTLGAYPNSEVANKYTNRIKELFKKNNNEILGNYHCHGAINPKIIEKRLNNISSDKSHPLTPARIKRWEDASTHPDEDDIKKAQEIFKEIINKFKETNK